MQAFIEVPDLNVFYPVADRWSVVSVQVQNWKQKWNWKWGFTWIDNEKKKLSWVLSTVRLGLSTLYTALESRFFNSDEKIDVVIFLV